MARELSNNGTIDERIHRLERQCARQRMALIALPLVALLLTTVENGGAGEDRGG